MASGVEKAESKPFGCRATAKAVHRVDDRRVDQRPSMHMLRSGGRAGVIWFREYLWPLTQQHVASVLTSPQLTLAGRRSPDREPLILGAELRSQRGLERGMSQ